MSIEHSVGGSVQIHREQAKSLFALWAHSANKRQGFYRKGTNGPLDDIAFHIDVIFAATVDNGIGLDQQAWLASAIQFQWHLSDAV